MQTETCCSCGIAFCMEDELYQQRKKDHELFYCPNGHSQYYAGKNKWEKQIEELKVSLSILKNERDYYRESWEELRDEFATCPFDNCTARSYHYSSRQTLLRHLADRHGIRLIERKALTTGEKTG